MVNPEGQPPETSDFDKTRRPSSASAIGPTTKPGKEMLYQWDISHLLNIRYISDI